MGTIRAEDLIIFMHKFKYLILGLQMMKRE